MSIMDFQSKSYLIVVDFHSHYPEFHLLSHKRSEDVIVALKSVFAVNGVPVEVVADNMPFSSHVMKQFASPHYAKPNGVAE